MSYSIIIPIYNEKLVLPELIKKLYNLNKGFQIIIIDDGSNDGTSELLEIHSDRFNIIQNKKNIGKGASIRKGINIATSENIILIDGDLEIDIGIIPSLIKSYEDLEKGVLLGVRWKKNHKLPNEINRIGNFIINSIFNFIYKTKFSDVLCCIRIINSNVLKSFNLKSDGFGIEVETMARIVLNKIDFSEKVVNYKRRNIKEGKKLKMTDGFEIISKIFGNRFFN